MIWLIGSGLMSVDYAKVLEAQNHDYLVIGRGQSSAEEFTGKTGKEVIQGGLDKFLDSNPVLAESAIISVGVAQLYETTLMMIESGVKNILVEKPGGMTQAEMDKLYQCSLENACKVYIAYNRRFFSSVVKAQEMIELDGGVTSFNFELTEWSHIIGKLDKQTEVLNKWFLANSTHVADLAFFLGGKPDQISCFTSGSLDWHSSASIFAGAGITTNGALFNYGANWESAGRWSVEVLTKENRYIFRPMESLLIQKRGTIPHVPVEVDNQIDIDFKPGLYRQVESFLSGDSTYLCPISEQLALFPFYEKMAAY